MQDALRCQSALAAHSVDTYTFMYNALSGLALNVTYVLTIFNLGSGAISWASKRQAVVALSSCEAEYMGQTQATKEALWLKLLLDKLLPDDTDIKTTFIFGDNQANNPQFHARTKHIGVQHHFVREKIADRSVDIRYINTRDQIADGLTKPLPKDRFQAF